MATDNQQVFKGEISLSFDYKKSIGASVERENILSERINYLMIEYMYENVNILPVIYISLNISSEMYTKMVNSSETSRFYLRVRKRDVTSKTSIFKKVVEDTFTYVTSSNSANYADTLNSQDSYKQVMIGLVSDTMTNLLRQSFNGIYNDISTEELINIALNGLNNVVKAPIKHNPVYGSFLIPPTASRYKLLDYIRRKAPFYDSNYTFFMDFNCVYLIPKNGQPIQGLDYGPSSVVLDIKNFTAAEAYKNGFTVSNGSYLVYINAADTNMIVNNSSSKVTNNIVGFTDYNEDVQNFTVDNNNTENNTTKTTFIRDINAAESRNELENNSVMMEILKQNVDGDIFTPNKGYIVSNYGDYAKYNGAYYLSYKREFYYTDTNSMFVITSNIGLKMAGVEEEAKSLKNNYAAKSKYTSNRTKYSSTKNTNNNQTLKNNKK